MDVYEELIRERDAGRSCALAVIVNSIDPCVSCTER